MRQKVVIAADAEEAERMSTESGTMAIRTRTSDPTDRPSGFWRGYGRLWRRVPVEVGVLFAAFPLAVVATSVLWPVFFTGAEAAQPPAALLRSWFDLDFYSESRERNYRGLAPKVIVEPLIFGRESPEDIKVFCYDGHAVFFWIDVGRFSGHRRACFDLDGAELPFEIGFPRAEGVRLPANRPELLALAEKLARPFRGQVRVDLYTDGRAIYCGELTNCPGGALDKFPSAAAEDWLSARIFATH